MGNLGGERCPNFTTLRYTITSITPSDYIVQCVTTEMSTRVAIVCLSFSNIDRRNDHTMSDNRLAELDTMVAFAGTVHLTNSCMGGQNGSSMSNGDNSGVL